MNKNLFSGISSMILAAMMLTFTACNSSNVDRAERLDWEGKTEEAIKLYQEAIDEGNIEAISKLALLYANTHKPEKAKEYYKMAVDKGDKEAAGILANFSLRDENYEEVITYLKPIVDAGDTTQVYTLGSAYVKLGQYDQAVQVLLKNKNSVYVKTILGTAYYELGDMENAEKYWKSGVYDHRSGGINSYNKLLELYKEQGRTADYEALEGAY
ncbi:tetratricopeptide repeat protein [Sphingobacterium tabacisoli]|uniref:Tetratricopeptide repeat protein n=1 Tax=Sphingobacterium tabacisoli TaxID=2044855 RepID=A0ABW5KZT7_9SPHI|nr:tetratricopeptide repeat protein [Sphingobacterium tabacisoli]